MGKLFQWPSSSQLSDPLSNLDLAPDIDHFVVSPPVRYINPGHPSGQNTYERTWHILVYNLLTSPPQVVIIERSLRGLQGG